MDKFQNKYRIPSARAQWWDYRRAGAYFITICTYNRAHYLGEIVNGQMKLSHVGVIADILWHQIPFHARHIELGAFVVMPNHVHGILIITDAVTPGLETGHALSLTNALSLHTTESHGKTIGQQRFQNIGKNSVSSIVGSYKSAVTKHANRLGFEFQWQSRFHDHIIRDAESFERISNYIANNPLHWQDDNFFNAK